VISGQLSVDGILSWGSVSLGDRHRAGNHYFQEPLGFIDRNTLNFKGPFGPVKKFLRYGDNKPKRTLTIFALHLDYPSKALNIYPSLCVCRCAWVKTVYPKAPKVRIIGSQKPTGGVVFQCGPKCAVMENLISVAHGFPEPIYGVKMTW
jgi:hypothetical protein